MPSPTRVGLVGLGQTTNGLLPGGWASAAHLPYLLASPNYELVAVANSSVASARASIKSHKLGPNVNAYGSSEDLARDPDVDLVVVSVQVGKHFAITKPALLAGKNVFVEWPLCATTSEEEELARLADTKGVKTIVGVQARASPFVVKIKDLVSSGQIGKVTSSTVTAAFPPMPYETWPEGAKYFLDIDSGGNSLTINFGHFLDSFVHVLGDFISLNSILRTEHPTANMINDKGIIVHHGYPRTSPDYISVQGSLSSGAAASLVFRSPAGLSIDGVGFRWIITGTDGEIELTAPVGLWQMLSKDGVVLKARIGKGNEVKTVDFGIDGEDTAIQEKTIGANTGRLYEAFAVGNEGRFATFWGAMETHRLLDRIRRSAD